MAIKYTICVILMIELEFLDIILCKKMKRGQSKAQQQGFFKKKACQRQVDAVQCRSEQSTRQGQVCQQTIPEPGSTGQSRSERTTPADIYLQQQNIYKKFTRHTHTHTLSLCLDNERS